MCEQWQSSNDIKQISFSLTVTNTKFDRAHGSVDLNVSNNPVL